MADWSSYSDDEIRSLAGKPVGQWDHMSDDEVRKIASSPAPRKSDWSQEMVAGIPVIGPAFDKAIAGSQSLIHGTKYSEELEKQQAKHEQYTQEHPIGGRAANIAGNFLLPIGPETTAAKLTGLSGALPMRVLGGGATGATVGATDAAVRNGLDPNAMISGAEVGGGIGAAAPVVGAGIGKAVGGLADWLGPKIPEPLTNLTSRAREMLSRALGNSTPQELAAARSQMGPETFVGEMSPGLQTLTGSIGDRPEEAGNAIRTAMTDRLEGSRGRIENTVSQNVGARENVPQTLEQLLDERSRAAKPLYDAAFNKPVPGDPRLLQLYQHPTVNAAMMKNLAEQQTEALAKNQPFQPNGWRMLDAAKRGLDDAVEAGKDPLTKRATSEGRTASMLRTALVQRMDELNPEYAAARKAWEGPTKVRLAAEKAKEFLNPTMDKNEMAQQFSRMTDSEKAGARLTMRNQLAIKIDAARNGDTTVRNQLLAPHTQAKIATAFDQNTAESTTRSMEQEANIKSRTTTMVPNWQTGASNVTREERKAVSNPPSGIAQWWNSVEANRPSTWLGTALEPSHHIEAAVASANERARQQLAPVLTSPAENDSLLKALMAVRSKQEGIAKAGALADYYGTRGTSGSLRRAAKEFGLGQ